MPNSQKKCAITSLLNRNNQDPCQWENCTRTFADPPVLYDHLIRDHVDTIKQKPRSYV